MPAYLVPDGRDFLDVLEQALGPLKPIDRTKFDRLAQAFAHARVELALERSANDPDR